jgi:hypothetical protein
MVAIPRIVAALEPGPATTPIGGPAVPIHAPTDRETYQETDSGGRLRTRHHYYLIIENVTPGILRDVRFVLRASSADGHAPRAIGLERPITTLAPNVQMRFPVSVTMGSDNQCELSTSWQAQGRSREEYITKVRFV